jgi:hypothetical protein
MQLVAAMEHQAAAGGETADCTGIFPPEFCTLCVVHGGPRFPPPDKE